MAKKNRDTLKGHFAIGKKPDSQHFSDLIDSVINIVDDGVNRSVERGLLLSPLDDNGAVMGIHRNILDENPAWVIALGKDSELLISRGTEEQPVVTLRTDGGVVLGSAENGVNLEVKGSIQADRFMGSFFHGTVPANGTWYDIGEASSRCIGYHIVAACRLEGHAPYSLAEVTAMHCFGKRSRIWKRRSWFGRCKNRIKFRWHRDGGNRILQIKARSSYGKMVKIHYRINSLFDEFNVEF